MKQETRNEPFNGAEIAIIGMDGRFPGAGNIEEFWNNLKDGVESVSFFSEQELEDAGIESTVWKNPNYVKASGVLDGIEFFDALFFDFLPGEVAVMDPQMRIFHECAWKALEDAGYDPGTYDGFIGCYAGASSGFLWEAYCMLSDAGSAVDPFTASHLRRKDFMSTRISYKLNLKGPSFTMSTACSTSLVAVNLACQGILGGECDLALAGGITVSHHQKSGYMYREAMIFSLDGHCRAFDANASGTIFGSGVGIVVLKLLEQAIEDNDHIYAVIKGFATNNDGMRKTGYTAPSIDGQAEAIRAALRMAEVPAESITYVETHGTGTSLGDPVEIEGLTLAFDTNKKGFCRIGSVKSNVGHLDNAAGVAGFIKAVLAVKHRLIPPALHFESPNQKIDFKNTPFYVNTGLTQWENDRYPLRAGVSSFGIGGTNAHVVLEEWRVARGAEPGGEPPCSPEDDREYRLLLLSAKTEAALERMTRNLANHLKENRNLNLADVAYTLQVGRKTFPYRKMSVCSSYDQAVDALSSPDSGKVHFFLSKEEKMSVIFMFPGQGSQYVNMGLELYREEAVFREEMDRCFDILKPLMDYDIKEILYPSVLNDGEEARINQTEVTQPVIFVFEYALAKLLMKWGITPYAMMGHSIGEYVAACLSGVFSLEDALKLVALRGKLMQRLPHGSMLGVSLPAEELNSLLPDELDLAAVNAPSLCAVSGTDEAVDTFKKKLEEKGVKCSPLHTSHAFHSKMMEPVITQFQQEVGRIRLNKPEIPYISNLTGKWITVEEVADPAYWAVHLRNTVKFSAGVTEVLKKETGGIWVEVGPGNTLGAFVKQHKGEEEVNPSTRKIVGLVRHPKEKVSDLCHLLTKVGQLWLYGKSIDWTAFYNGERRRRISLPTYSFEKHRYPFEGIGSKMSAEIISHKFASRRKPDIADWFYVPSWERTLLSAPCNEEEGNSDCWLVFAGSTPFHSRLLEQLRQEGQDLVVVRAGNDFTVESDSLNTITITINPGEADSYDKFFKELQKTGKTPQKILHLWEAGSEVGDLDSSLNRGFYSLLYMVQALGRQGFTEDIGIGVVTEGMQDVTGEERLCPEKALLLGAVRVIPKEYPNIRCSSIDLILPEPGGAGEDVLVSRLIWEGRAGFSRPVVAWRGNYRWEPIIKPHRLDKHADNRCHLKEEGIYLITGGLGGIGLTLARHLAASVKARLILTSRSGLLAGNREENSDKLRELEELGAKVLVVTADVTDRQQMEAAIARGEEAFGPLSGVIHAAGLADYAGVIQRRTREMSEAVLAAKVRGTLVLDEVLNDRKLDFFVLCSSVSSILAPFGQVAYTAGNTFLDAFALYKANTCGQPVRSIGWGAWQQVGMAVEAAKKQSGENPGGVQAFLKDEITPQEGIDLFDRIVDSGLPWVVVSPRDLRIRSGPRKEGKPAPQESSPAPVKPRPELSTVYVKPKNRIENQIAEIWQEYLGIREVGIHDNLFDLGATSLDIMQVNRRLKKVLAKDIPVVTMFEYPTVHSLFKALDSLEVDTDEDKEDKQENRSGEIREGKRMLQQMLQKARPGDRQ